MIEARCLKNVVIFFQAILSFVLSRKIINVYNHLARKYGNLQNISQFFGRPGISILEENFSLVLQ